MVIVVMGETAVLLRMAASQRHIGFAPDDGFDPGSFGFSIKLDGAEHIAMVCHGHGRLAECFDLLYEGIDLIGAVEQTKLSVQVEMHE